MQRRTVVALAFVFVVGVYAGVESVGPSDPEFVKIPGPTKVVHETGPTVYVKTPLDQHCKDALQMSAKIASEADKIYASGDQMLAFNAQFRQIMASHENTTKVEEDLRALQATQIGHLAAISDALTEYGTEIKLCKESQ